jgi:hypothetical protein
MRERFLAHLGSPGPTDVLTHSHRPGNRHRPYHRTRLCVSATATATPFSPFCGHHGTNDNVVAW